MKKGCLCKPGGKALTKRRTKTGTVDTKKCYHYVCPPNYGGYSLPELFKDRPEKKRR